MISNKQEPGRYIKAMRELEADIGNGREPEKAAAQIIANELFTAALELKVEIVADELMICALDVSGKPRNLMQIAAVMLLQAEAEQKHWKSRYEEMVKRFGRL